MIARMGRRGVSGAAARLLRGRPEDPPWVRPALLALLLATALLYLWGLGGSGWANAFYSAAVQAATKSWKAFFFGSFDAANFITVDKPPLSLWAMDLSARIFGLNPWSILVPEALMGVATVYVLYLTVRRTFGPSAGLIAGALLALTPVAALMFRYNNPDAMLVLLLTLGLYAGQRALETTSTRWLALAALSIGLGFMTKTLAAFLVVPGLALVYLAVADTPFWRRVRQLLVAALTLLVASGWWVATVQLWPAAARPYIGGSQDNSELNLTFGYNGFGRLTGHEAGSVGGGGPGGWGLTGLLRLFQSDMGGQISWLLPAALLLLALLLWYWRSRARQDPERAQVLLWAGWLLVTGVVFSLAQGIIHPYYTVALAPPIAALAAIGATVLWRDRARAGPRLGLAVALAATSLWSFVLLERTPEWLPWLRAAVLALGLAGALAVALGPVLRRGLVLGLALGVCGALAGPAAYTFATAATPHSGAIPSAGPSGRFAGAPGGPGGFGGGAGPGRGGSRGAFRGPGAGAGAGPGGLGGGGGFSPGRSGRGGTGLGGGGGGFPRSRGGFGGGGPPSGGAFPGAPRGGARGSFFEGFPGGGAPGGFGPGGAGGGLLNASAPSLALQALLEKDAGRYTWVLAVVGANSAAGYQLATGDPVMAIGGFNGTDPAPSLSEFETLVKAGRIHYFIAQGRFGGPAASQQSSAITNWVEQNFTTKSVGGTTVFDLTSPKGGGGQ